MSAVPGREDRGPVLDFLARTIGLDPESIGLKALRTTVARRMEAAGVADEAAYARLVKEDPGEQAELVEAVLVPETWFFRDQKSFAHLLGLARQAILLRPRAEFRVLCVPCSSGEEAYSVAMTLCRAGYGASNALVEGVDISQRAIEAAARGIYGPHSFRGGDPATMEGLRRNGQGWEVAQPVRDMVRFNRANILDPGSFPAGRYQAVFCRNLLIYLTREARAQVLARLGRALAEEGTIFTGHAETLIFKPYGYVPVAERGVFACVRQPEKKAEAKSEAQPKLPKAVKPTAPVRPAPAKAMERPRLRFTPQGGLDNSLAGARRLADQGELAEAETRCGRYLAANPLSAEGHLLLGLIHQAAGNLAAAEESLSRAVYLDPCCREALEHLSFLCRQRGETGRAEHLRQRAGRIAGRDKGGKQSAGGEES